MLKAANLSAGKIVEILGVAKWIVASAIDEETGRQKFPREWNHDYIDLPVVEATEQARPTLDAEDVAACIANAKGRYRVLYALLAGTGLRIGEALAIHLDDGDHTTISPDCKTINVRKSMWREKEQAPKTPAAKRSVDLCNEVAAYLKEYIGGRTSGLLFQTDSGLPLAQSNIIETPLANWMSKASTRSGVFEFLSWSKRTVPGPEKVLDRPRDQRRDGTVWEAVNEGVAASAGMGGEDRVGVQSRCAFGSKIDELHPTAPRSD